MDAGPEVRRNSPESERSWLARGRRSHHQWCLNWAGISDSPRRTQAYISAATEGISEALLALPNIRVPERYPSVSLKSDTWAASSLRGTLGFGNSWPPEPVDPVPKARTGFYFLTVIVFLTVLPPAFDEVTLNGPESCRASSTSTSRSQSWHCWQRSCRPKF